MIAELLLITELLKKTVGTPNSTSEVPSPTPTTGGSLVGDLFALGPITEIKQSFELPIITPKEATDAYLDAIEGIEITSLPFLGKR